MLGLPEGNLLIDTPPDLRTQLLRERIRRIHSVLYTHDHADHLFGLMICESSCTTSTAGCRCIASGFVEARIRKSFDYAFTPQAPSYGGGVPQLEFHEITTAPFDVLGQRIIPMRLEHGRFQVLGFRFGNVAYCTDTNAIPDKAARYCKISTC